MKKLMDTLSANYLGWMAFSTFVSMLGFMVAGKPQNAFLLLVLLITLLGIRLIEGYRDR